MCSEPRLAYDPVAREALYVTRLAPLLQHPSKGRRLLRWQLLPSGFVPTPDYLFDLADQSLAPCFASAEETVSRTLASGQGPVEVQPEVEPFAQAHDRLKKDLFLSA
jgi:hypothetical protein